MTNRGTVIIHELDASNDITIDQGFEHIGVAVALDHDTFTVVDADISAELLERRLRRDGWTVLHEDDVFEYDPHNGWQRVES
jgi:uncharacterized protein YjlB